MHTSIDASQLKQMVICASAALGSCKQQINDLNVFPVPDGDTGTNMGLTISTAASELKKSDPQTVTKAADITASAMLRGARGNSGVILSLLFRGFSRALKGKETMDGKDFAHAISEGVAAAYKAVMKPAEGTILTVSRLSAEAARGAAETAETVEEVISATIGQAKVTLAETTDMNPVLKKAGVVDAGGMGYVVILEGMLAFLNGAAEADYGSVEEGGQSAGTFSQFETEDITFTYCTEFIVERENSKDPSLLSAFLENRGDCIVVVDDDEIIKVHVHTNHPGQVLEEALTYGSFLTVKVENMRKQHTEAVMSEQDKKPEGRKIAPPEKQFGFVTVCAGDGLATVFRDLGADGVIYGGQTMNPSTEDILKVIDSTPAETVFVLPNNKNIIMAAQQCIPLSTEKKVIVIGTTSIPEGVAAMLSVDTMADEEANTAAMEEAIQRVMTAQITYAARNSDFDGHDIREGDYMSLVGGKLRMANPDQDAILEDLANVFNESHREFITVFYGADVTEERALEVQNYFTENCPDCEVSLVNGGQPVYYFIISAE